MLVFGDKRQININNWLGDEIKKLRNVKYLAFVIRTDEQKELYRQYKDLLEENKNTRDKYIKGLNKIKAREYIAMNHRTYITTKNKILGRPLRIYIKRKAGGIHTEDEKETKSRKTNHTTILTFNYIDYGKRFRSDYYIISSDVRIAMTISRA